MSTKTILSKGVVGVKGAEDFTGLSRPYLYKLMKAGKLPYTTVGDRRLIPRKALEQLLATGLKMGAA